MGSTLISVAKILKPHGIKGEIKVYPLTDDPLKRFEAGNTLVLEMDEKHLNFKIEASRPYKQNTYLLKLSEIDSIEEAEQLRGKYLKIPEEDLLPLDEGEYYIFEIIGLNVYNDEGEYIGKLYEVQQTGSNDVYIIKKEDGKELLIPALKDVVKKIDLDNRTMNVKLLPGLE